MSERVQRVLRIERTFDAPIERVFEAWHSEEVLTRWLHANPHWDTPVAEGGCRVGGTVRIVMPDPETGAEWGAHGEYTVVEPPGRPISSDRLRRPPLSGLDGGVRLAAETLVLWHELARDEASGEGISAGQSTAVASSMTRSCAGSCATPSTEVT